MTLLGALRAVVCEAARVEHPREEAVRSPLPGEAGAGARAAGGWGRVAEVSAPLRRVPT